MNLNFALMSSSLTTLSAFWALIISVTLSVVISFETLQIISLDFLSLCFSISNCSPNLALIAELSEFISSSLPVSIKIPLSLIVLKAYILTLISVGFMSLFIWFLICWTDRVLLLVISDNLYLRLDSPFSTSEKSFLLPPSDGSTCLAPLLRVCCMLSRDSATCLAGWLSLILSSSCIAFLTSTLSLLFSSFLLSRCVWILENAYLRALTDSSISCLKSFRKLTLFSVILTNELSASSKCWLTSSAIWHCVSSLCWR